MAKLPVNFLWIGERLGPIHAACIASFLDQGHRVLLHSFEPILDAPRGVEPYDAHQLMDPSEIIRTKNGSLTLAADIYRLRILRKGLGIYSDCDSYCIKPLPDDEYLFGWEGNDSIATGILNIPPDSELLRRMLSAAENPKFVPPWWSQSKKSRVKLKTFFRADRRPWIGWAMIGPSLLTHHAKQLGLASLAKPADVFYPLNYHYKALLNDPGLDIKDLITHRTLALHLWSSAPGFDSIHPDAPVANMINAHRERLKRTDNVMVS